MSSIEPTEQGSSDQPPDDNKDVNKPSGSESEPAALLTPVAPNGEASQEKPAEEDAIELDPDILTSTSHEINNRRRLLDTELRILTAEYTRLTHERIEKQEKIKDNLDKIENNR